MRNFAFHTTKSIVSEVGGARKLGQIVTGPSMRAKAALVITDAGVIKAGLVDPCVRSMEAAGVAVAHDTVVADPPEHVILHAVETAKKMGADCIVGIGGGSSMDVAKVVALLAHPDAKQPLSAIYGVEQCEGARLPLVQVPTTAGTGSEVTPISIVTTGEGQKKGIVSNLLLPDVALLDAALTLSVPPHVTAATGIDAMVHAIEAYTSKIKKNPLSDALATEAMKLLGPNIERACAHGSDVEARAKMLLGSCYAGMAFANSPVAAVHALAYPIGAQFHVAHGLSNSLVLPYVLRFNSHVAEANAQYADCCRWIYHDACDATSQTSAVKPSGEALADHFALLARTLGIETQLRQVGIAESDLDGLAENAMLQTRLLPNNPREVTLADARAIYGAAW